MHLKTRNVNSAFVDLVSIFYTGADGAAALSDGQPVDVRVTRTPSRNGPVLMIEEPVLITYSRPRERVLFSPGRDASPFFHLYEALYMLTGGDRIAPLAYYAKQMAEYSDDGRTQNGAYGHRWRHGISQVDTIRPMSGPMVMRRNVDQLDVLVAHLKREPGSRRAVLNMWNVEDDLLRIDGPRKSKDVCCNLEVMFSIRKEINPGDITNASKRIWYLDITVTNRSNDLIWGALGANYVQFTVLQEYMAARLGAEVGVYNHFTNNLHVYTESNSGFRPEAWLADHGTPERVDYRGDGVRPGPVGGEWMLDGRDPWEPTPLVTDPAVFETEVRTLADDYSGSVEPFGYRYQERFLETVAKPMFQAFRDHKQGQYDVAIQRAGQINSADWRLAATAWLQKRTAGKGVGA
jgi:hypothetical protein